MFCKGREGEGRGCRLSKRIGMSGGARRHANFPALIELSRTVFSGATRRPTGSCRASTRGREERDSKGEFSSSEFDERKNQGLSLHEIRQIDRAAMRNILPEGRRRIRYCPTYHADSYAIRLIRVRNCPIPLKSFSLFKGLSSVGRSGENISRQLSSGKTTEAIDVKPRVFSWLKNRFLSKRK